MVEKLPNSICIQTRLIKEQIPDKAFFFKTDLTNIRTGIERICITYDKARCKTSHNTDCH
jgi:hypothetical protein